ncbi:1-phosphofructokinase family hexose kinase [Pedobacter immunditicola]|uniref:1-phosphofructokinase family hexose kinase n=1 Tax=Pedobacter immunditicola TaxID=3133440 RepID=UPI0030B4207B
MATIITITFNPAIDKSTTVPQLIPEKKLHCTSPVYEPGGGGINVARAIKRLGGNATAIYLEGGYSGKVFTELLRKEKIDIIPIRTLGVTRENLVVKELSTNKQFRFGMPGDNVSDKEWKNCVKALSQIPDINYIVVSGSLPTGIPADIFVRMASVAHSKNARLIVDTSGVALHHAVEAGTYLIKPNLRELALLVGKDSLTIDEVERASKEIINKHQCEVVITSLGAAGAMLTTKESSFRIIPPEISIQSTVGAGDSMLAGIVFSLSNNKSLIESAQYGVACGTAATMNQGTELCHLDDVNKLYPIISNQTIP